MNISGLGNKLYVNTQLTVHKMGDVAKKSVEWFLSLFRSATKVSNSTMTPSDKVAVALKNVTGLHLNIMAVNTDKGDNVTNSTLSPALCYEKNLAMQIDTSNKSRAQLQAEIGDINKHFNEYSAGLEEIINPLQQAVDNSPSDKAAIRDIRDNQIKAEVWRNRHLDSLNNAIEKLDSAEAKNALLQGPVKVDSQPQDLVWGSSGELTLHSPELILQSGDDDFELDFDSDLAPDEPLFDENSLLADDNAIQEKIDQVVKDELEEISTDIDELRGRIEVETKQNYHLVDIDDLDDAYSYDADFDKMMRESLAKKTTTN